MYSKSSAMLRLGTNGSALPAIAEDRNSFHASQTPPAAPPVPPRAWNRPAQRIFGLGPSISSQHDTPPAYSQFDSTGVEGPHGEKLSDVRKKGFNNNKHIAKRGGWKRLALLAFFVVLCIIGLAVGLFVGLRNRNKSSSIIESTPTGGASGSVNNVSNNSAINTTFPAGSYRIQTVLSAVTTNCTSNSATWMCYPYTTFAQNPKSSNATFDWIISNVEGTDTYTISSTPNIFSIQFANVALSFMDSGTDQEHYFFSTPLDKPTRPTTKLGVENTASQCNFPNTNLQGALYTRMAKTPSSGDSGMPFAPWPYAVKIEQIAGSGAGSPTCTDSSGNSVGDFSVATTGEFCDCVYINTES